MADNVTFQSSTIASPPAGLVVATDDVGGVDYQIVKLAFGPLDTATLVTAAAGFPVNVVAGTVAATQSGAWSVSISGTPTVAVSGSVAVTGPLTDTQLRATAVPVSGPLTDAQLRATAVPVSLSSVPSHPVTNAGTFAVQVSSALPAGTNNIGDVDVLTLPPLPAGTNNIGDVDVLTLPALAAGTNLIGAAAVAQQTDVIRNGTASLTPLFATISASATGNTAVVAADGTRRIRVLGYRFQAAGDVDVQFRSGATTTLTGSMPTGAKGGGGGAAFCPIGHFQTAVNEALNINLSANIAVGGHVVYVLV